MDSINASQSEENRRDLRGTDAITKIKEIVDKAQTCFFCTSRSASDSSGARPMNVRQVDDNGHLWFLSANDSHKNMEIEHDPSVTLFFQGSPHSDFMELRGTARVSKHRSKIEELWEPVLQTWFTGGINDPRITAIEVEPTEGYYWDNKHGNFIAGIKMFIGATLHRTLDDSIEGSIKV